MMPSLSPKLPETKGKHPSNNTFFSCNFHIRDQYFPLLDSGWKMHDWHEGCSQSHMFKNPCILWCFLSLAAPVTRCLGPAASASAEQQQLLGPAALLPGSLRSNTVVLPFCSPVTGLLLPREHGWSGSDGLLFHITASPGASATNWMASTRYQTSNNRLPWWRMCQGAWSDSLLKDSPLLQPKPCPLYHFFLLYKPFITLNSTKHVTHCVTLALGACKRLEWACLHRAELLGNQRSSSRDRCVMWDLTHACRRCCCCFFDQLLQLVWPWKFSGVSSCNLSFTVNYNAERYWITMQSDFGFGKWKLTLAVHKAMGGG